MTTNPQYISLGNGNLAPSTRFQGSKRKLLPWLKSIFDGLEFSSALDLMSGTASVSYLLKRMGKQVISNDYLRFNYLTAQGLVENERHIIEEKDLKWILDKHSHVKYGSFVEDTFEDFYYTPVENRWIDQVICNINELESSSPAATHAKQALATHSLIQACLMKRPFNLFHRRNLNLRLANVKRTFGNQTTWNSPFEDLLTRKIKETNSFVFDNGMKNRAMNEDALHIRESDVDLVYLDPPYFRWNGERRQSNYRFGYHFVEGLAQYNEWPELLDTTSPLLALKPNGDSSEVLYKCDKSILADEFLEWLNCIVINWPNVQIVMSYKRPGIPTSEAIKTLLEETGREVILRCKDYQYALNRRNGNPNENLELLFVAS